MNEEFALAISETLSIINSSTEKSKIPKSFMEFLIKNANPNYKPEFDSNIAIKDLKLRKETKGLLSLIYLSYLSNEEEKVEFNNILKDNNVRFQQKLMEETDVYKVFNKRKNNNIQEKEKFDNNNVNMIEYRKENIFKKILNKIISFFRRR